MALNDSAGILFRIKGDSTDAVAALRRTGAALDNLDDQTKKASASSGAFASFVGNLASSALSSLTSGLIQASKEMLAYSSRMEQTRIGFNTLIGNSRLAAKHIKDLQEFAKSTPFEFEGLADMSRRLQGVGVEAEKVVPILKDIGNAAAAAGASGAELDSIALAISQIIAKGKVSAEEVNQLAERGIPAWRILAEQMGKTKAEVIDLAEKGKISSDQFLTAFQKFSKANFGDAMEKQSRTFAGAMSNIKDSVQIAAASAFEPLYKKISELALETAKRIEAQKGDFNKIGLVIGDTIGKAVGLGFGLAIRQIFVELGKLQLGVDGFFKSLTQGIIGTFSGFGSGLGGLGTGGTQTLPASPDYTTPRSPGQQQQPVAPSGPTPEQIKQAEELRKRDLAAYQEYLDELSKKNDATLDKYNEAWEKAFKDNLVTAEQFREAFTENERRVRVAQLEAIEKTYQVRRAEEKKTAAELRALQLAENNEKEKLIAESFERERKFEESIAAQQKDSQKQSLDAVKSRIAEEIRAREDAARTILARREKDAKTEEEILRARAEIETDFLNFKLQKLNEELAAVKGNAEEEKRVRIEISKLREEQERNSIRIERETGELQIRNAKELLELKKQIREEERRILDFRREQERKTLTNVLESQRPGSRGEAEARDALIAFEIEEATRRRRQREEDIEAEREASLERIRGKENEEAQKAAIEELYRQQSLQSAEEFYAALSDIEDSFQNDGDLGFFGQITQSWETFLESMLGGIPTLESSLVSMSNILQDAFEGMANALGSVVEQWVLYGNTGPAVMRKILASALATIAAEAAVRAIYALAYGFLMLATGQYEKAGNAFVSAAFFGAVAGVTALAGRAVAGNSFKQQTATATGGASGTSTERERDTSSQGQQFSSQEDRTAETSINQPHGGDLGERAGRAWMRGEVLIRVESNDSHIVRVIKTDSDRNGPIRTLIREVAEGV